MFFSLLWSIAVTGNYDNGHYNKKMSKKNAFDNGHYDNGSAATGEIKGKTVEMSDNVEKVITTQKEYAHMCRATVGYGDVATPYIRDAWNKWKGAWNKLTDEEREKCKEMTNAPIPPMDHKVQIDNGANDIGHYHMVPRYDFLTDEEWNKLSDEGKEKCKKATDAYIREGG